MNENPSKKQILQLVIRLTLPKITVESELSAKTIASVLEDIPATLRNKLDGNFGENWEKLSFSEEDISDALATAFILSDEMVKNWEKTGTNKWKRRKADKVTPLKIRLPEDTSFTIPVRVRFIPQEVI